MSVDEVSSLQSLTVKQADLRKELLRERARERYLREAAGILKHCSEQLKLPHSVIEQAMHICRQVFEAKLTYGRSHKVIVVASIYAACRLAQHPRSVQDFDEIYPGIYAASVAKTYRLLRRHLNLKTPLTDTASFIVKIGREVGFEERIIHEAIRIREMADAKGVSVGKSPITTAAVTLYVACLQSGLHVTQEELAGVAGITEVTLRNRTRETLDALGIDLAQLRLKAVACSHNP